MLIVGGGPVGMTLALARPQTAMLLSLPAQKSSRVYALGGKASAFLQRIGALPIGNPVRRFLLTADNEQINIHASAVGVDVLCHIVRESALLECLQARILDEKVNCRTLSKDSRIIDYQVSLETGRLFLSDGGHYETELLIAADGARSAVATAASVGAAVHSFEQRALTMVLRAPLDDDCAAQWFSQRNVLALLPLGGGLFSLVWSLSELQVHTLLAKGSKAVVAAAAAHINMPLEAVDATMFSFPLFSMRRAVRVTQRLAFVGNAARVIHPLAGQGLNLGLLDAELLWQCLDKNKNVAEALAVYAEGNGNSSSPHVIQFFSN